MGAALSRAGVQGPGKLEGEQASAAPPRQDEGTPDLSQARTEGTSRGSPGQLGPCNGPNPLLASPAAFPLGQSRFAWFSSSCCWHRQPSKKERREAKDEMEGDPSAEAAPPQGRLEGPPQLPRRPQLHPRPEIPPVGDLRQAVASGGQAGPARPTQDGDLEEEEEAEAGAEAFAHIATGSTTRDGRGEKGPDPVNIWLYSVPENLMLAFCS
nr:uncharacterized protein LOC110081531 [Pogona vitticeps]